MADVGRFALVGGVAALAIGVGVAVVRHNHRVDDRAAHAAAERARYDQALRVANRQVPRFEVSYVNLPLVFVQHAPRRRYTLVGDEVARRIVTGQPSLHPDFARLAGPGTDTITQLFREGRVQPRGASVMALLVTQTTHARVVRVRLEVERLALPRLADVWDPLDLLVDGDVFRSYGARVKRRAVVDWRPRGADVTAIVPLSVLNEYRIPDTPANHELLGSLGVSGGQVASGVVLAPRRLLVRTGRREIPVAIGAALHPLEVTTIGG